jgi:Protein of unknown function (DUF3754)
MALVTPIGTRPASAQAGPRQVVRTGGEIASIPAPTIETTAATAPELVAFDALSRHRDSVRQTFIPITNTALVDRLTHTEAWGPGEAQDARRFFQYLDHWRRQSYTAALRDVDMMYEPFNPDSDLLATRAYSAADRANMQAGVVAHVKRLLEQANYVQINRDEIAALTQGTHFGLDMKVDLDDFDELLIYYRGRSSRKEERREMRKFYRKIEFDLPIFRRLFVLFKIKPAEQRVVELMESQRLSRKDAEKRVKKLRARLPPQVKTDNIYMKLFKNMPRSDIEMIFPNTQINFRMMDKIKLGVTSGAGLGMGIFGAAGKLALVLSNPFAAVGAAAGLGGIALRQGMNFMNQRQKYMVVMAQNLYFHAMADNRSAMIKLADRAAEEDVKEEMLLYAVLAKKPVRRDQLNDVDRGIEQYLKSVFDLEVDFDLMDALGRLLADGIVTEGPGEMLVALSPAQAAFKIDQQWDRLLDDLITASRTVGVEVDD